MTEFLQSQFAVSVIVALALLGILNGAVAYCIYYERKISAWIQDRYGPNRVGPWGLLQPIADGLKFILKEDVVPRHVDKVLFVLAPGIALLIGFIGFAAIPWGGQLELGGGRIVDIQVAKLDIGLLYMLGVASLGVYAVVLGGWASNNKFAFYGAIRATAQMLSYEIPLGLCVLTVVLTMGTLRLETITAQQATYWFGFVPAWNVFLHPLAFVILFITALAEANRAPFDLAECEQELVAGYHTEYSALKFGMFFLGEYAHMLTSSALIAVLFLGGWHFPWIPWTQPDSVAWYSVLLKFGVLFGKVALLIFVMMWVRWTLPRFRFDQLMRVAWNALVPMTLGLVVLATLLLYVEKHRTVWALVGNVAIVAVALLIAARSSIRITGRQSNMPPMEPVPVG